VSTQGDWVGWFSFFLEVIEEQARDATARARRLSDLRTKMRTQVSTARASAMLPLLVDQLFVVPAITINMATAVLGVTPRAAGQNLDRLVAVGILQEVLGSGRTRRLFIATEVLDVIEGRPPELGNTQLPSPGLLDT
jgi:Fic family protein